ncbi:MAG: glycosyltransferase family 2 protein [Saprospiraceae bacterium]|nr:glycosyltransferase family 2 protein [Saprospiraceae bacterium]
MEFLFWLGIAVVFYAYLGYGIVLLALVRIKRLFGRNTKAQGSHLPDISFVVCAFNEADWIEEKIANSLALDYPKDKVHFWWVTDGSSDATPQLVERYPFPAGVQWTLLHQPERRGKIAAFQRAMAQQQAPVVVSTDANTLVNTEALHNLVRHFNNPAVGAVAGEKRITLGDAAAANSAGEGIYWKYESALKRWDYELYSVVGAAGELFAFRTEAYEHVPSDTIIEDFYLTLRIAQKGWRVAYEPEAYAVETASASVPEELKRKVRIAAGGIQAIVRLAPLLNLFRYGVLSFQYISHRVLRWTLAPLLLPVVFVCNLVLAMQGKPFYQVALAAQLLFYAAAWAGYLLAKREIKVKALFIPYYFCVMNYAVYAGFLRYVRGRQSVLWERAERARSNAEFGIRNAE